MKPKKRKRKISKVMVWKSIRRCEKCGERMDLRQRGERASSLGRPNLIATHLYHCVDCGHSRKHQKL